MDYDVIADDRTLERLPPIILAILEYAADKRPSDYLLCLDPIVASDDGEFAREVQREVDEVAPSAQPRGRFAGGLELDLLNAKP